MGGRAACLPAPAHPPLTVALRFALVPLPPTRTECQEGPVAGAWEPLERRLYAWAQRSAGGCSLLLACPFSRAGQLRGAPMSLSGCGPGAPSLGTPGPGVSLSLKVWLQVSTLASGSWRAGPGFLLWPQEVWRELPLTGASPGGSDPMGRGGLLVGPCVLPTPPCPAPGPAGKGILGLCCDLSKTQLAALGAAQGLGLGPAGGGSSVSFQVLRIPGWEAVDFLVPSLLRCF